MWNEFSFRKDFSTGQGIGIDLVVKTMTNEYWAIQCKCYQENEYIDKKEVNSFLSTSNRYYDKNYNKINFKTRLFILTTNNWSLNAENAIKNQTIPCLRLGISELEKAEVDWDLLEIGVFGVKARLQQKIPRKH